jgi:hypothetical protein
MDVPVETNENFVRKERTRTLSMRSKNARRDRKKAIHVCVSGSVVLGGVSALKRSIACICSLSDWAEGVGLNTPTV